MRSDAGTEADIGRRQFNKMVLSVVGGLVAGSAIGCGQKKEVPLDTDETLKQTKTTEAGDKNVCKGMNACKGQGGCKTADNDCRGHNDCSGKGGSATASKHACAGKNSCKEQGGCRSGDQGCAGKNTCQGKGGCGVPLSDGMRQMIEENKKK